MRTLLIRAEDKNRWERRVPLVPEDLEDIIKQSGIRALVQRSDKRFIPEKAYQEVGVRVCEDISSGDVIIGIKEIPEEKIIDNKVYIFFSHTIKGQKANMPLLKRIIESQSTLIDYERIVDFQNHRLVYFGQYAGDAGAIDILSLMGEYWAYHGLRTPFIDCRRAHQYASVDDAKRQIRKVGDKVASQGFPQDISPLVIGILGYGNVSRGAQEIFDCLPVTRIDPGDLANLDTRALSLKKLYLSIFKEEHLARPANNGPFELKEYYTHPERYVSCFDDFLPHISILVNAVYWEAKYPRFVTWAGLKALYQGHQRPKLCGIADISCDVNGSIECNVKTTDSDMPAYLCDPKTQTIKDGHRGDGIVVLAVDNLPCELPLDASVFFSRQLKGFVSEIVQADYDKDLTSAGLGPEIEKAVIVYNGQLTPDYQYLESYL